MDFQCVFWNGRTEKHQTSTARFRLAEENGQHRPFPIPCVLFPHPLQNRVPRGECVPVARKLRADRSGAETKSFCPCQKSQVSLLRYLTFSLVSGKIWQQGLPAGPPAVRVVGACSPVGCVQARPRRQPRPSPSAPDTKPAKTLGFCRFPFFMCCIAIWCILVRISGFPTRPYRLHPSPAPETHPVSPFLAQIGCVFLFFAVFWPQNFRLGFCATCHIVFTS